MKKILLPILGTVAFVALVAYLTKNNNPFTQVNGSPAPVAQTPTKFVAIDSKTISVEIADTEASRQLGLGKRSSLPQDQGMLFVFDTKGTKVYFWMKDMQFPLDLIWITGSKITRIDENVQPQPGAADKDLTIYGDGSPTDYVLEVNAGVAAKDGFKIGDTVDLSKAL